MAAIPEIWLWIGFNAFVLVLLALDLGVFHRNSHVITVREAATWTVAWVSLAALFAAGIFYFAGSKLALEFVAGYLIEYSLSVDNIFVFVLLFTYFRVPATYQHRVLFWGILGALIMRGTLIVVGAALIERFEWIIYIFGAFLIFTGLRMAFNKEDEEVHPDGNIVVRLFRRIMPVTQESHGHHFFIREAGRWAATPLFIVLLIVETTDLIFAVDSIPAIFAVTRNPFIVYTSNVFAILGLRSLYFLLSGVMDKFYYLKLGLAAILTFVGVKMLLSHTAFAIRIEVSLAVIIGILALSVVASLIRSRRLERVGVVEKVKPDPPLAEKRPETRADTRST